MATPKGNGVPLKGKEIVCELCGEGKCSCNRDVRVYFCPRCKSTNVKYVFGLGNLFGVVPKMKCFNCGFSAAAFPILETNKKELSKVSKKKVTKKKSARKRK